MQLLAERLRRALATRNKTQLAQQLGIDRTTIYGWQAGRRVPGTEDLRSLALLLEVSVDYLLGLSDDPRLVSSQVDPVVETLLVTITTVLGRVQAVTFERPGTHLPVRAEVLREESIQHRHHDSDGEDDEQ